MAGPKTVEVPRATPYPAKDAPDMQFADGLSVIIAEGAVILTFLQSEFPLEPGTDTSTTIRSRCIGRIAISSVKMLDMLETLERVRPSILESSKNG